MKSFSFRGGEIIRVAESKDLFTAEVKSPSPVGFLAESWQDSASFLSPTLSFGVLLSTKKEGRSL